MLWLVMKGAKPPTLDVAAAAWSASGAPPWGIAKVGVFRRVIKHFDSPCRIYG
jgi:hypothetical protein